MEDSYYESMRRQHIPLLHVADTRNHHPGNLSSHPESYFAASISLNLLNDSCFCGFITCVAELDSVRENQCCRTGFGQLRLRALYPDSAPAPGVEV